MKQEPINLRLKRLRKSKGLSQEAAAEKLRMSRQTVNNWERNRSVPDYYALLDIKKIYDVSWDELMGENVNKDDTMKALAELYESLLKEDATAKKYEDDGCALNIKALSKAGYYDIIDEDLSKAFGYYNFDCVHIAELAIRLKQRGYLIVSVFENGFSIFFKTDKEAEDFAETLDRIIDHFIHYWEEDLSDRNQLSNRYYLGVNKAIRYSYNKIFDIPENQKDFYCLYDSNGNERGFSMTKEGCEELAKIQKLEEYEIHLDDEDE